MADAKQTGGWAQLQAQLQSKLEQMQPRERWMLMVMVIFLICTAIGLSLWKVHQLANAEQQRLTDLKAQINYMQQRVVSMKPAGELELSLMEKIQRVAQQSGLTVQAVEKDGQAEISLSHANYAMVAQYMMQLSQLGVTFAQYNLSTQDQQIKLTATVH